NCVELRRRDSWITWDDGSCRVAFLQCTNYWAIIVPISILHTVTESTCDRKKFSQAEREGATLSWSFCFPLSLIGVKCIAAWTFSSRRAICSQPMTTQATG